MSLNVGNLIEVKMSNGYAYGVILALPAAYPPAVGFLPQIHPEPFADASPDLWEDGYRVFLSPLNRAQNNGTLRVLASRASPDRFPAPTFRVPILDRNSHILYEWHWHAGRIELPNAEIDDDLPVREIVSLEQLKERLNTA